MAGLLERVVNTLGYYKSPSAKEAEKIVKDQMYGEPKTPTPRAPHLTGTSS